MNLEYRIKKEDISKKKDTLKKVFFYRICGTGMGAAAILLKQAGYEVHGGDNDFFPPMSDYLEESKVVCKKLSEISDEYLKEMDLIIVGNVVAKNSLDAKRIEELGVPFTSFPEALGELYLKNKKVIGVSGTHGKTTTSYFLVQLLNSLGIDTGYLIGGVLPDRPSAHLGESDYFVIESDEYDTAYFEKTPKFHHYDINELIITSLEYDHADIYENVHEITNEFKKLAKNTSGNIFYNPDYSELSFLEENGIKFTDLEKVEHLVRGRHNQLNLKAALSCINYLGEQSKKIEVNLKLPSRRQEFIGHVFKARYYDDFAHHPRAVEMVVESFKEKYEDKNICLIFEPASATARSDIFQQEFFDSLKKVESVVIIKPIRETTAIGRQTINYHKMENDLKIAGVDCSIVDHFSGLYNFLESRVNEDWIVVSLSNGKVLGLRNSDVIQK